MASEGIFAPVIGGVHDSDVQYVRVNPLTGRAERWDPASGEYVGVGGSGLGDNAITVGAGGMYATIREALDYIVSQDTYTDLGVTGVTASVTANTKLVSMTPLDSSTTSNTIGLGDKTFVVTGSGRAYVVGSLVTAAGSLISNYMQGTVKTWNSGTNTLVITVTKTGGSGTFASWKVGVDAYNFAPLLKMGDLWSGDNGANWYEIATVITPSFLKLEIPYRGATLSGAAIKFARPVWYSIVLLPGEHGDSGALYWPVSKPMYVDINALPGARFTGEGAIHDGTVQQLWHWPTIGHIRLHTLVGRATKSQSAFFQVVYPAGTHINSIIEMIDCDIRAMGVDVWIPSEVGRLVVKGGYYEAGQDVFVNGAHDGHFYDGAHIVGSANINFSTSSLPIRMFAATSKKVYAKNCTLEIRHYNGAFNTSIIFDADSNVGDIVGFTADRCTFKFDVDGAATTACIVAGGFDGSVKLNQCSFESAHASGTPNIMKVSTGTRAGTVSVNNAVLNGFVAGGGGTIIPVLNNCTA